MILSEINFFSESLGMRSTMGVILPQPGPNEPVKPFRTCICCTATPTTTPPGSAGLPSSVMLKA
jgi:hypothetical protein